MTCPRSTTSSRSTGLPDGSTTRWYDDVEALAHAAVEEVLARSPTMATTRLLAVDGPAGSGKTTLAHRLAGELRERGTAAVVLSLDDLYDGWSGLNPSLDARVVEQILEPLADGRGARWQAYDWAAASFGEWRDLAPTDVLVLEGCGAGARHYAPYITLLLWLEAPAPERRRRALERDGRPVLAHWARWAVDEEREFSANDTRARADLAIHG